MIEYARSAQRCGNGYVIMYDINRLYFPCLRQGLISPVGSVRREKADSWLWMVGKLRAGSEWMGLRELLSVW